MRIGWLKFNGSLSLDPNTTSTSAFVATRKRMVDALVHAGCEIVFLTPLLKEQQKYLHVDGATRKRSPDSGIYTSLWGLPQRRLDLLLVENGPDNTTFGASGGRAPAMYECYRLIQEYEGPVAYLQSDPDLPFPFFPENYHPKNWIHLPYGTVGSLQKNKAWAILTLSFCTNMGHFARATKADGDRFGYLAFGDDLPLVSYYAHWFQLDPKAYMLVNPNPLTSLCYIGRQRGRKEKFIAYYGGNRLPPAFGLSQVYGKWPDTDRYPESIDFLGVLDAGKQVVTYNNFLASVIIGDTCYEEIGFISGRFFDVLHSGAGLFVDDDLPVQTLLHGRTPPGVLINTENATEKLAWWQGLTVGKRRRHIGNLRSIVEDSDQSEKLIDKLMGLPKNIGRVSQKNVPGIEGRKRLEYVVATMKDRQRAEMLEQLLNLYTTDGCLLFGTIDKLQKLISSYF